MPERYVAQSLFDLRSREKQEGVYHVVDAFNERFGKETVRPGVVQHERVWGSSAELRSPAYTTNWSEIARVKAV